MTPGADVLVVGGGVIGCAVARELAGRGARVALVERGRLGGESSSAAAGLLSPQAEAESKSPLFDAGLASRRMYADWVADLEGETLHSVGFRRTGVLRCALSEAEERRLLAAAAWQSADGLPVEAPPTSPAPSAIEPLLAPEARGRVFFPDEAIVHCPALLAALERSLALRGVAVETETAALRLSVAGGVCRGVETSRGPREATTVVLAAGAWSPFDSDLPAPIPVRPVRGQIIALRPERAIPVIVQSEEVYLAPRSDGRLLIGATVEEAGFRKDVTAEAIESLLAAARRLLPSLGAARFDGAWAGLRPGSPDGLPLLGAFGPRGLFLAAGHFRSGILLAPWTARLLADAVTGAARVPPAFSASRFHDAHAAPRLAVAAAGPGAGHDREGARISGRIF